MGPTPYPLAPDDTDALYRVQLTFGAVHARAQGALGFGERPILPIKTSTQKKRQKT